MFVRQECECRKFQSRENQSVEILTWQKMAFGMKYRAYGLNRVEIQEAQSFCYISAFFVFAWKTVFRVSGEFSSMNLHKTENCHRCDPKQWNWDLVICKTSPFANTNMETARMLYIHRLIAVCTKATNSHSKEQQQQTKQFLFSFDFIEFSLWNNTNSRMIPSLAPNARSTALKMILISKFLWFQIISNPLEL